MLRVVNDAARDAIDWYFLQVRNYFINISWNERSSFYVIDMGNFYLQYQYTLPVFSYKALSLK